ncbi:hypothetical protein ERO13_D08G055833v2 [Gossypium hirsutum]|nr:hypothetical protein ERO13_D08G055833v2 [Gossypium hirsutum]
MEARERRDLRRWLWLAAAGAGRLPRVSEISCLG